MQKPNKKFIAVNEVTYKENKKTGEIIVVSHSTGMKIYETEYRDYFIIGPNLFIRRTEVSLGSTYHFYESLGHVVSQANTIEEL